MSSPMEILSLWKRCLDPFDAARIPFPSALTPEQIKTGLSEKEATILYGWFFQRSKIHPPHRIYAEIADYIEDNFTLE